MNGRERILAVLAGQAAHGLALTPITMMFAARQIGVPYRKYATDHRLLVQGQLHVAEKFAVDHVSCISDPCREAMDCGAVVKLFDDQPPAMDQTQTLLADKSRLGRLKPPDPLAGGRMTDRVRAAALFRERIGGEKLIEGWIEGPCGQASNLRGINTLMSDFFDDPPFVRGLLEFVVEMELRFARAQVEAGVDSMGIGDPAASLVGPRIYDEFIFPCQKRMIEALHAMGVKVRLHICGNTRRILGGLGRLGCDIIDADAMVPLAQARAEMGPGQVIAGNLNPVATVCNGTPKSILAALEECCNQAGPRWIVAAGCEVPRDTPEANFRAMTDFARSRCL